MYKKTSTGKIQEWTISVEGNVITTRFGQRGGKIQTAEDTIDTGKNIGRSNETSPEQQAESEARSAFEKKLKKDYVRTLAEAETGSNTSDLIEGGILPMLAHRYDKHGDKIKFPCYAQPKLDGHRCIAVVDSAGKCTLWSRTRKPILSMPHIVDAIQGSGFKSVIIDGELYQHAYSDRFEEITSLIRPAYAKEGADIVQYHVYDMAVADTGFEARQRVLAAIAKRCLSPVQLVDTVRCPSASALKTRFEEFVADGYEGAIVRNADGLYKNGRSYDLQKVKEMEDSEFKIVGVKEGRGKLKGHGIFQCEVGSGSTFDVKMAGPLEGLVEYFENPDDYIGEWLTVQYQGLTADGIPRFPVGLRFKEDI